MEESLSISQAKKEGVPHPQMIEHLKKIIEDNDLRIQDYSIKWFGEEEVIASIMISGQLLECYMTIESTNKLLKRKQKDVHQKTGKRKNLEKV